MLCCIIMRHGPGKAGECEELNLLVKADADTQALLFYFFFF